MCLIVKIPQNKTKKITQQRHEEVEKKASATWGYENVLRNESGKNEEHS